MAWSGLGGAVAVIVSRKRRMLTAAFERENAVDSASARTLEELGLSTSVLVKLQQAKGVVVDAGDGRFFLDRTALARADRTRRIIAVAVAVVTWLIVFFVTVWLQREVG